MSSKFGGVPLEEENAASKFGGVPVDVPEETQETGSVADATKVAVMRGLTNAVSQGGTPIDMGVNFWTGVVGTTTEKIAKDVFDVKGDIAGSVAGGMAGSKIGSVGGTLGRVTGGIIGGILGSTGGKQVDQELFGTQESQDLSMDFMQSTKEEFLGRLIAKGGKGVVKLVDSGVHRVFGERVGVTAPKTIDDLFLKDESGRSVGEAEKSLTGESLLTTFEATGGKAGGSIQAKLDMQAVIAGRDAVMESATLKARSKIMKNISSKLEPSSTSENLSQGIKDGLVFAKESFDKKLNTIKDTLIPAREKVEIDVSGIRARVDEVKPLIRGQLPENKAEAIIAKVDDALSKRVFDQKTFTYRNKLTLGDVRKLENDIEGIIENFSPTKNAQGKTAGVYSGTIKNILEEYVENTARSSKGNIRKVFDLERQFKNISKARAITLNSRIAKRIGATEVAQDARALKTEKIEDIVFESPQTWKEAQDLFDTIGHPEVSGVLQDRFKQRVVEDLFSLKGDIKLSKIEGLLKKNGDELISDVAGKDYLQALKDTRLVVAALSETNGLEKLVRSAGGDESITRDLRRSFLLPLARRVGMFNLFTTGLKKSIGIEVKDETLLKSFQGEAGQRRVEKLMNTPMSDPASYNTYVQVVREINKVGGQSGDKEVPVLDRKTYVERSYDGILAIMKGLSEE